ncbi:hypothetical protein K435DRAFT_854020 [Dendrothele bispora CBS 962.96]|uniref:Uncharacterized protein n=1 Tax=Dendrothele bispora (strain CBS 962.96) TaxID=1314807 RepID=A0A4S8MEW7_DENBC|nr:hypothetical protein K435DRAFT_854020 [Dendrothele bispora CBS 962.96]
MYPAIERISNAVVQALDVLDDVLRTGKQLVIAIVDFAKAVYALFTCVPRQDANADVEN